MFTVKHIDRKGIERLHTASSIKFIADDGGAEAFGNAGLYLDPEEDPAGNVNFAKHCFPISRVCSSEDVQPMAYVMNERGATVASYRL